MKTAIFYFSGTGNTERVVKTWLDALNNCEIEAVSFRIEDKPITDLTAYDRIGIAYPIHAFNAPQIVLNFAKALPAFPERKRIYLIMVSGEPLRLNDSSDRKLKKILKGKNAEVESAWHYIMPYNMIFRHTESRAWRMYDTMQKLVPLDVKRYFIEDQLSSLRPIPFTGFITSAFRIEQWFSSKNGRFYRVTDDCIKCMKCVDSCPVHNIKYQNGKIRFENRCILCTRCSFGCPKDAIQIGMLNGWRVNKPYKFSTPETKEFDSHKKFCHRSYERYFKSSTERIQAECEGKSEGTEIEC